MNLERQDMSKVLEGQQCLSHKYANFASNKDSSSLYEAATDINQKHIAYGVKTTSLAMSHFQG